jgi:nicotinate-nucleotide adenylyltransferase
MNVDQDIFQFKVPGPSFRFGLFGGSFDPIHYAHLLLAETVRTELALDKIIFMPAALAPHKPGRTASDGRHRLAMIQIAIKDNPAFSASSIELLKNDISYTVDTLEQMQSSFGLKRDQIYLIIGADNLHSFQSWKNPNRILQLANLVVVNRPDYAWPACINDPAMKAIPVAIPMMSISASAIRERVRMNRSIRYYTPLAVQQYITTHKLYQDQVN